MLQATGRPGGMVMAYLVGTAIVERRDVCQSELCGCGGLQELSEIIETSASKHQLQVLLLRTDYEQRLCEKDEQIRAFREELDSLLEALEALRGRPRGAAPASTASRPMVIAGRV